MKNAPSAIRAISNRRISLGSLLMALLVLLATTGVVGAHSYLVRSTPARNAVLETSPARLQLWFSEPPEPRFAEVRLLDGSGRPLEGVGPLQPDAADPTLLVVSVPPLRDGVYTVTWRAPSSVDGHVTAGSFAFAVGKGQLPPGGQGISPSNTAGEISESTPLEIAVRWLGYLGMALLFGTFAFVPLVLWPALGQDSRPPGTAEGDPTSDPPVPSPGVGSEPSSALATATRASTIADALTPPYPPLLLLLLPLGLGLSAVAFLMGALLQSAASSGVTPTEAIGPPLVALLSGTRYGTLFWIRLSLLGLVGALMAMDYRQLRGEGTSPLWWWIGLELSGLVVLTWSAGSHAAAGSQPYFTTVVQALHMMAASVWLGGLVALILTLPWLVRIASAKPRATISRVVDRFSLVATVAVLGLSATGVYRAVIGVADPQNLLDTAYGMALLAKLGLIVPLLGLAAINLLLIRRRLATAGDAPEPETAGRTWQRYLRGTVGGEVLLVCTVLLATGVLATLPPSRDVFGAGIVMRAQAEDLRAVLAVDPGRAGFNSFDLYLREGLGQPMADTEKVALIFSSADQDLGETEAVADDLGGGHYQVQGGYLSTPGGWRAQLLVRRTGRDDARATFTLNLTRR